MAARDTVFAGAIADLYDSILGPFMFEPFAREMAARFAGFDGQILEIAAGTGILTRELNSRLAKSALITATDLNPPMLDVAVKRLKSPRITVREADALALPFDDQTFHAVACQFGVMFYPDPVAGHREAFRVLKPGGHYILSVWDDLASNSVAERVQGAVADCFPVDPPLFLARTPHGHHEVAMHRHALADGGFSDVSVETVALNAGRLTADELALGFCQGTPLRHEIEARGADLAVTTRTVARALRETFGDGPIESTIRAHVITASR